MSVVHRKTAQVQRCGRVPTDPRTCTAAPSAAVRPPKGLHRAGSDGLSRSARWRGAP
jgi:hypothetical protein